MTTCAFAFFDRIVFMSLFETGLCELVARLTELHFGFYEVVLILRAVDCMACKTPIR
jgi:hypothetical protein